MAATTSSPAPGLRSASTMPCHRLTRAA
jgi:hypothetical protein